MQNDNDKSIKLLIQYIELAQQKGSFVLAEADVLKRACDILVNKVDDKELNEQTAIQILIQGVQKGQKNGSYTLNEASLLHRTILSLSQPKMTVTKKEPETPPEVPEVQLGPQEDSDDLADLAEPIPLKPKEI